MQCFRRLLALEAPSHVSVGSTDEPLQCLMINLPTRPKFDMPHQLSCAFQQSARIGEFGTAKKPDVHVIPERIDVTECRVPDTRCRMTVMHQLPDVVSAGAHHLEPVLRDLPQIIGILAHPDINGWLSFDRTGEPEELIHREKVNTRWSDAPSFKLARTRP